MFPEEVAMGKILRTDLGMDSIQYEQINEVGQMGTGQYALSQPRDIARLHAKST
jgi:hypothetical protein